MSITTSRAGNNNSLKHRQPCEKRKEATTVGTTSPNQKDLREYTQFFS